MQLPRHCLECRQACCMSILNLGYLSAASRSGMRAVGPASLRLTLAHLPHLDRPHWLAVLHTHTAGSTHPYSMGILSHVHSGLSAAVEKLKSGRCWSGASDPSTCQFVHGEASPSAYFGSILTAQGAPLARSGCATRAACTSQHLSPMGGAPKFRPWPICGWGLQRAILQIAYGAVRAGGWM